MNNKKNGKKLEMKYHCIKCDFHSNDKCDYERHLSTRKHKMDNLDKKVDKLDKMDNKKTGFLCNKCGRKYKYQSGLCKHKKKCHLLKNRKIKVKRKKNKKNTDDEKEILKSEIKELRTMMKEMIKKQGETNESFIFTIITPRHTD